jgi:hypothetical protein
MALVVPGFRTLYSFLSLFSLLRQNTMDIVAYKHQNLFLVVLKVRKSKIKVPAVCLLKATFPLESR